MNKNKNKATACFSIAIMCAIIFAIFNYLIVNEIIVVLDGNDVRTWKEALVWISSLFFFCASIIAIPSFIWLGTQHLIKNDYKFDNVF